MSLLPFCRRRIQTSPLGVSFAATGGIAACTLAGTASAHPGGHAEAETLVAGHAEASAAEKLAAAYGIDSWNRIDRVDFTFHVKLPNGREVQRAWSWEPEGDGGTVTFAPGTSEEHRFEAVPFAEDGTAHRRAKRNFVNDSYWLAFPFQLIWSDPTVVDSGPAPMPISGDTAERKLTAAWPTEGGFTPGDAYDLFLGADGRIDEWSFRRGGGDNGRPATWGHEVEAAGVTFATEFRGPEGSGFVLSFPQLKVWADGADEPVTLRGD